MAFMPALGFRGRLLLAMLSLVLMTSAALFAVVMFYLLEDEKDRATQSLDVAERVTTEIMDRRTELLVSSLQVLVEDFGFRSAIASGDSATINSVLENHSGRAGADLAMILSEDGRTVASLSGASPGQPFPELLARARRQGLADAILNWNDAAYQVLMVPVRGAGLRAWLAAGFVLDTPFARSLSALTGTEVAFMETGRSDAPARLLAASASAGDLDLDSLSTLKTADAGAPFTNDDYFIRTMALGNALDSPIQALLLIDREEALASYYNRATDILIVVLAALLVAALVVLVIARALGRPVLDLARFAAAIGEGERPQAPRTPATSELKILQQSLVGMVQKLGDREQRIRYNAFHDELTGLPNRKAMTEALDLLLDPGRSGCLIGINIRGFREINDTLGFALGDQILRVTGQRLNARLGERAELIARTGGNEFLILLDAGDCADPALLTENLRDTLEETSVIDDTPISIRVTLAVLELPRDAQTADEVRRRLNLTLEQANRADHRIAFYQPGGDELHMRELTLSQDLQHALNHNLLDIHYQPKIDLRKAAFVQVEALARWHHPELGFISPEEFILLAERTGQIRELTRFILRRIADDARRWHSLEQGIGVAINLSALDLTNPELPGDIHRAFADWRDHMGLLTFEITESAVMTDTRAALKTLDELRAMGVCLSVDDFGTGYSSLSQLRQLPVQELKIDKSFVMRLHLEPQDRLIVRSTIDMAHGLGLTVVAEGIENLESWHLLRSWGCEKGQGFYMARPMPAEKLGDWAREFRQQGTILTTTPD